MSWRCWTGLKLDSVSCLYLYFSCTVYKSVWWLYLLRRHNVYWQDKNVGGTWAGYELRNSVPVLPRSPMFLSEEEPRSSVGIAKLANFIIFYSKELMISRTVGWMPALHYFVITGQDLRRLFQHPVTCPSKTRMWIASFYYWLSIIYRWLFYWHSTVSNWRYESKLTFVSWALFWRLLNRWAGRFLAVFTWGPQVLMFINNRIGIRQNDSLSTAQ